MKTINKIFFVFVIVFHCSCSDYSFLQRKYTDGRYIAKNGHAPKAQKIDVEEVVVESLEVNNENEIAFVSNNSISSDALIYPFETDSKRILNSIETLDRSGIKRQHQLMECDTLVLQGGKVLKVKVVEINERKVRYRLCEASDKETIFEIFKEKVELIKYANSEKIKFTYEKKISPPVSKTESPTGWGALSLLSILTGWWFFVMTWRLSLLILFWLFTAFLLYLSFKNWRKEKKISKFLAGICIIFMASIFIGLFSLFILLI